MEPLIGPLIGASLFGCTISEAMQVLASVFPGRKVVGINPEPVNAGGGGLNCISNNMPAP